MSRDRLQYLEGAKDTGGALDLGAGLGLWRELGDLAHMSRLKDQRALLKLEHAPKKVRASGAEGRLTLLVLKVPATLEGHLRGWGEGGREVEARLESWSG